MFYRVCILFIIVCLKMLFLYMKILRDLNYGNIVFFFFVIRIEGSLFCKVWMFLILFWSLSLIYLVDEWLLGYNKIEGVWSDK